MAHSVVLLLLGEKSWRDVQQKSCTKRLVKETSFWGMFSLFYLSHVFWVPADAGRGVTAAEPCSWPIGNHQRLCEGVRVTRPSLSRSLPAWRGVRY